MVQEKSTSWHGMYKPLVRNKIAVPAAFPRHNPMHYERARGKNPPLQWSGCSFWSEHKELPGWEGIHITMNSV